MRTKPLFIVTAVIEGATALALLIVPSLAVSVLLSVPLDTPGGLVVGRVAGAALGSLAIACWQARNGERGSATTGIVAAMLFYNAAAAAILVYAGTGIGLHSDFLWPAIVVQNVLALWCLIILWITATKLSKM